MTTFFRADELAENHEIQPQTGDSEAPAPDDSDDDDLESDAELGNDDTDTAV